MSPKTTKTLDLDEEIAFNEARVEELKVATGPAVEVGGELAQVRSVLEILYARRDQRDSDKRNAQADELQAMADKLLDEVRDITRDRDLYIADHIEHLTEAYGKAHCERIRHPGRGHPMDPDVNSQHRRTNVEKEAASKIDLLNSRITSLTNQIAKLRVPQEAGK